MKSFRLLFLAFAFCLSAASGFAQEEAPKKPTLNLEAAMRAWQERWIALTGADQIFGVNNPNNFTPIVWPVRRSDGMSPGPFPPDCFYEQDMQNPNRAASLVLNFITAVSTTLGRTGMSGSFGVTRRFDPLWANWGVLPGNGGPTTTTTAGALFRWLQPNNTWAFRDASSSTWSSDFAGVTVGNYPAKFQTVVDHWLNTPCRLIWRYSDLTTGTSLHWTYRVTRSDYANCNTCQSCATGNCIPGLCVDELDGGLKMTIFLGQGSEGSIGTLQLRAETTSADLATPYKLATRLKARIYNTASAANTDDNAEAYTIYDESTYISKGQPLLRQVVFPQGLVDIVQATGGSNNSYTLYFYDVTKRGTKSGLFFTPNQADAHKTIKIENGATTNELNIIESTGSIFSYTYNPAINGNGGKWAKTKGVGPESVTVAEDSSWTTGTGTAIGDVLQEISTTANSTGALESKVSQKFQIFPWNADSATGVPFPEPSRRYELIETVVDPDVGGKQITTTYRYYDDVAVGALNYGRLKQIERSDGSWSRFEYDSLGRVTRTYTPFKDSSYPAAAAGTPTGDYRLTETVYGTSPSQTFTESIRTGGVTTVISRRFHDVDDTDPLYTVINEVQATAPAATYTDPANLFTTSRTFKTGKFIGSPERVVNPDGTVTIYSYQYSAGGDTTVTTSQGAPNNPNPLAATGVSVGTRTTVQTNPQGQEKQRTIVDAASGLTIENATFYNFDVFGRWRNALYLGGFSETRSYDCCGLESATDRTGIRTVYGYDSLHRVKRETRYLGATSTKISDMGYGYDAAGRRNITTRYATGASADLTTPTSIVIQTDQYNLAGQQLSSTTPRGTTLFAEDKTPEGRRRTTTTNADLSTQIAVYRLDGSMESTAGTAAAPVKYDVGVDADGYFSKTIRVGDLGAETEWTKSYTDFAGRPFKTVLADGTVAASVFNAKGQLVSSTPPPDSSVVNAVGTTTFYLYNSLGQVETTAQDLNKNGLIDYAGMDRIIKSVQDVAVVTHDLVNYTVSRSTTSVWAGADEDAASVVSVSESTVDGLRTWQTQHGLTTKSVSAFDGNGGHTVTASMPDGTQAVQTYAGDRLVSSVSSAGAVQHGRIDLGYDGYGRTETSTDARNGVTKYTYFNDNRVKTVTTPDPDPTKTGPGYDPQVTQVIYDSMGRQATVTLPDAGVVNYRYWPTGQLKRTWGARTYPQELTYDAQGRLRTLATWTNFTDESTFDSTTGKSLTTWNYNSLRGWLDSKRYNDNRGPDYFYYPSGKLKQRAWARGTTATYSYSAAGELAGIVYSDTTPAVSLTYDRLGRRNQTTDAAGVLTTTYKDLTSLSDTDTYGPGPLNGLVMSRGYDAFLRPNALNVPAASYSLGMTYRDGSRLDTLSATVGGVATAHAYTYQTNSDLIATLTQKRGTTTFLTTTRNYDALSRLSLISSQPSALSSQLSVDYGFNNANQRVTATEADGKYWRYDYDPLGQVTSGSKKLSDGTQLLGHDLNYSFDTIGNRTTSTANDSVTTYAPDPAGLNQYPSRTVPSAFDITGTADPAANVFINFLPADRQADLFHLQLTFNNTDAPAWQPVTVVASRPGAGTAGADAIQKQTGNVFVAKTPENFGYDLDGNLEWDGRWTYTWNAENQLISMETQPVAVTAGVVRQKLDFAYDAGGRRLQKKVSNWNGSAYVVASDTRFAYDGWNMVAEFALSLGTSNLSLLRSYVWGLDLSGSSQGAGGVGGLLAMNLSDSSTYAPTFDGNGNIVSLINAADGTTSAEYAYGPFGEVIKATGVAVAANPFGFSTKYQDAESGLLYYGYRYYTPSTGRWLSKDPIEEQGGENLYGFVSNSPTNDVDVLGLDDTADYIDSLAYKNNGAVVTLGRWGEAGVKATDATWSGVQVGAKVLVEAAEWEIGFRTVRFIVKGAMVIRVLSNGERVLCSGEAATKALAEKALAEKAGAESLACKVRLREATAVEKEEAFTLFNKEHGKSRPVPKGRGPAGGLLQSHHGVQQEWAINNLSKYGYDPKLAPSITLETGTGFPHSIITNLQNARRKARIAAGQGAWSSSLQSELGYIVSDFRAAGFNDEIIGRVLQQQYKMFDLLHVPYQRISGF